MMKALIFDCDGVLVDTERDGHREAFNRAFDAKGLDAHWDVELYGELLKIAGGKEKFPAIVDSAVSRMRPVMMAAVTTIFGMAPLLQDPFFVALAVTIMVGLGFATVLTLIVVPVLYSIFFRVPVRP